MRLNKFIAQNSTFSRRFADQLIAAGRVTVNQKLAVAGLDVSDEDEIMIDHKRLVVSPQKKLLIAVNKPKGVICSHVRQTDSRIIFDLLPQEYANLKIIGRLDKDTTGLCLLTNDGQLANNLAHPSSNKQKTYQLFLEKPLTEQLIVKLGKTGIDIGDQRASRLLVSKFDNNSYNVTLFEGRNRQIRRTFKAINNQVKHLHRSAIASIDLKKLGLQEGQFRDISNIIHKLSE